MRKIDNITNETFQRHLILIGDEEAELLLRFYPKIQMWDASVLYKGKLVNGFKLSAGTLHVLSTNLPFDFVVTDTSNSGIDPFKIDDFSGGRCQLYMLDSSDIESIRGQPIVVQ